MLSNKDWVLSLALSLSTFILILKLFLIFHDVNDDVIVFWSKKNRELCLEVRYPTIFPVLKAIVISDDIINQNFIFSKL